MALKNHGMQAAKRYLTTVDLLKKQIADKKINENMSNYIWAIDYGHGGMINGVYQTSVKYWKRAFFKNGILLNPADYNYDSDKMLAEDFYCHNNKLTSLEGAPKEVGGCFYCHNNKLTSLEGAPKEVGGGFYCDNNKLTSLEGAPEKVSGGFNCHNNNLTSLDGAPQTVSGNFHCHNNKVQFTEEDVHKVSNVKGEIVV